MCNVISLIKYLGSIERLLASIIHYFLVLGRRKREKKSFEIESKVIIHNAVMYRV